MSQIRNAKVGDVLPINILCSQLPGYSIVKKREDLVFDDHPMGFKGIVYLLLAPFENHNKGGWESWPYK